MRATLETMGALWQLMRLALVSRCRFRGEYWSWRWQTAFGRGAPASHAELARSLLAYARWVHRTRRGC